MIAGYKEGSLVDVPGRVAVVVFTAGCNLRCPYCHNADLVLPERIAKLRPVSEERLISRIKYLYDRGLISAVAITGGEPLLWNGLTMFLSKLREIKGLFLKVDTNGTVPSRLKELVNNKLVDYIAMDVKSSPAKYALAVGLAKFDCKHIKSSAEFLKGQSKVMYEFRTTVVPSLITEEDFEGLLEFVIGANLYALQRFRPLSTLDPKYSQLEPTSSAFLGKMAAYFVPYVKKVEIRK